MVERKRNRAEKEKSGAAKKEGQQEKSYSWFGIARNEYSSEGSDQGITALRKT